MIRIRRKAESTASRRSTGAALTEASKKKSLKRLVLYHAATPVPPPNPQRIPCRFLFKSIPKRATLKRSGPDRSTMRNSRRPTLEANDRLAHFRELCDLSSVDLSDIRLDGLQKLSGLIREFCERNQIEDARCACIVPQEFNQSLMMLYNVASKESAETTKVFPGRDQALEWLLS